MGRPIDSIPSPDLWRLLPTEDTAAIATILAQRQVTKERTLSSDQVRDRKQLYCVELLCRTEGKEIGRQSSAVASTSGKEQQQNKYTPNNMYIIQEIHQQLARFQFSW